jgi:hypothetical protein
MDQDEDFRARCAHARASHGEMMDDRIQDVAEGVLEGNIDPQAGKVAISAFQWRASKLDPKKYGDNSKVALTGENGGAIQIISAVPRPDRGE